MSFRCAFSCILDIIADTSYFNGRFGFVIGIIFSAIITSTLQGAVKAVLVCYVDHPAKMQEVHPEDTIALKNSILRVFPDVREFTYVGANGIV